MSNNFDQWQKDVFFSAAEEVQDSADIMESAFRTWMRDRRDGSGSDGSDDLQRELHTALGTTKWQLEEFEKAIKSYHKNCLADDTIARHRQFVAVIENQISRIEEALKESVVEEGKQALRWVQLNEEERDDLAIFLSGTTGTSHEYINPGPSKKNTLQVDREADVKHTREDLDCINGFKEVVTINKDAKYVVELATKGIPRTKEEMHCQGERLNAQRRIASSPDFGGAWKVVIADENIERKMLEAQPGKPPRVLNLCGLVRSTEFGTKLKWFKNNLRKPKDGGDHQQANGRTLSCLDLRRPPQLEQGIDLFNERSRTCFSSCREDSKVFRVQQLSGWVGGFRKQLQSSQYYVWVRRPLQVTFLLMLTIFLIVPFVLHAT